jgi:CheY-like chemotaxis protein
MLLKLRNTAGHLFLTIEYDTVNHWVYTNWIGTQTYQTVVAGAEACLDQLRQHHCQMLLNDNRLVTGGWESGLDWISACWTPQVQALGLRRFAYVLSPDALAARSATTLYDCINVDLHMRLFTELEPAQQWLLASRPLRTETQHQLSHK